jgi:hypothetical protein
VFCVLCATATALRGHEWDFVLDPIPERAVLVMATQSRGHGTQTNSFDFRSTFRRGSLSRHRDCTINVPCNLPATRTQERTNMIRKISSGKYRLYSRKVDPKTSKRRNLGTFDTRQAAEKRERAVQYFKHH